jgi:hypothetical protein
MVFFTLTTLLLLFCISWGDSIYATSEAIECSKMHYLLSIGLLSSSLESKYTLCVSKIWTYVVQ